MRSAVAARAARSCSSRELDPADAPGRLADQLAGLVQGVGGNPQAFAETEGALEEATGLLVGEAVEGQPAGRQAGGEELLLVAIRVRARVELGEGVDLRRGVLGDPFERLGDGLVHRPAVGLAEPGEERLMDAIVDEAVTGIGLLDEVGAHALLERAVHPVRVSLAGREEQVGLDLEADRRRQAEDGGALAGQAGDAVDEELDDVVGEGHLAEATGVDDPPFCRRTEQATVRAAPADIHPGLKGLPLA